VQDWDSFLAGRILKNELVKYLDWSIEAGLKLRDQETPLDMGPNRK
jgi:hypothetical protein